MKYHYDKIIIGVLIIFIFVYFFKNNYEYFFDRDNRIIPIAPPPSDSPQYFDQDYKINDYKFNTGFYPFTPSFLNEPPSQQQQLLQGMNSARRSPWLYSPRDFLQEPSYFPNYRMPSNVIGGGRRRTGVLSGTEEVIPNLMPELNISGRNIAPVNLTVRGFDGGLEAIGTIQKLFGESNNVMQLYGRKKYNNQNRYEYFCKFGKFEVLLRVYIKKGHYVSYDIDELASNQEVFVEGQRDAYRVTIYDPDIPHYLPVY